MEMKEEFSFYGTDVYKISKKMRKAIQEMCKKHGYKAEFETVMADFWGFGRSAFCPKITEKTITFLGVAEGYRSNKHNQGAFGIIEVNSNYYLITKEGQGDFYAHGQREGWLLGFEDGEVWISLVPSTMTSIKEALEWLKPALVKKAMKEGRKVIRQGDIYLIQMRGKTKIPNQMGRHLIEKTEKGIKIIHPEHKVRFVKGHNWKVITNKWTRVAD